MDEKVKQAFKLLCEQYVKDLNKYENKEIAKDYFYNPKYECGFKINGENVYFADILKALTQGEEVEKVLAEYGLEMKDFREACLLLKQWRSEKLCWIDYEKLKQNNDRLINEHNQIVQENSNLLATIEVINNKEYLPMLRNRIREQETMLNDLKRFAKLMFEFVNYNPLSREYWFSDCIIDAKDKEFKLVDGLAHAYFMKHEDEYNKLLIGELEKSMKTDLEQLVEKIPANAEMSIIEESQGDFISFRIVYKVPKTEGK